MNFFKKVLTVLIALSLAAPSHAMSQKAFIDDIFDDIVDDIVDDVKNKFTPFRFKVKDTSTTPATVSNQERQIEIIIMYKKKFADEIDLLSTEVLNAALNDNISARTKFLDEEFTEFLDEDLFFTLQNKKEKSKNKKFFEAHYLSNTITVNTPQTFFFELNLLNYLEDIAISTKSFSKTPEAKLDFKPIFLDFTQITFIENSSITNLDSDVFHGQNIVAEFRSTLPLNGEISEVDFTITKKRQAKKLTTFAQPKSKKKIFLDPILSNSENINLINLGEGNYRAIIPVRFELQNINKLGFFKPGKQFKVKLPLRVTTSTQDDLALKVRGRAKVKLFAL